MAIIKNYAQWLNEEAQATTELPKSTDKSGYGPLQYAIGQKIGLNDSMGTPFVSKEKPQTIMMLSAANGGKTLRLEMIPISPDPMAQIQRTYIDYAVQGENTVSKDGRTFNSLEGIQPPNNMTPIASQSPYRNVIDVFTMIKGRESNPGEDWKSLTAKAYFDLLEQAQPGITNLVKTKLAALGPNARPYERYPGTEPKVDPVFAEVTTYLNAPPTQPAVPQPQPAPSAKA